ncbi:MAG: ribonuclease Z [Bacteroidaceae bacterium]|nr:ribonuclease Z [Bacteroidaceae bacterium]
MKVHFLGCGSALPTMQHNNAAQVVETEGHLFLIDCGEGTQIWLRRSKIAFSRLQAVFISHLHGDHLFGLIGLISSFCLLDRKTPLHIYAPSELEDFLYMQIKMFCRNMSYEVVFHAIDTTQQAVIFDSDAVSVSSLPLNHKVPCSGFIFTEKQRLPHINRVMADFYHVPHYKMNDIKHGEDFITSDGEAVPYTRLTTPAAPARSYAYCSDTKYMPELHRSLAGVNVLYHEATYAGDMADKAEKYFHSTAGEAAQVAKAAQVERLYLGHYSQRYTDKSVLLNEAKAIFPSTFLSEERMVITV